MQNLKTDNSNGEDALQIVPLGDLCQKLRGVSYSKDEVTSFPTKDYVPILRANNIDDDELNYEDLVYVPKGRVVAKQLLQKGDVVIAMSSGSKKVVGKGAQLKKDWIGSFGAFCGVLRPNLDKVNQDYFGYYFGSTTYRKYISDVSAGTSINNLKNEHFENISFPLPPLKVQQAIAEHLDSLVPNIKSNKARLHKAKKLVAKFRQAILLSAITGKLTEDWQLKNLGTTRAQIDFVSLNKKRKVQFDMSHFQLFDIPEDWQWKQFWEVAEIKPNLVSPKEYKDYVLVAPDNIEKNTGRLLEKKLVKEINPISAKHLFFKGQIVYSKIRPYLSKLIFADFDGLCSADMYPISPKINVRYLMLFMLSKYFLDTVSNIGTRTLLPKTNQEELNSIPVPIPSLEEQTEIVARVDAYFEIADKVEKQIEKAETRVSKLTQAILAKVFNPSMNI